VSWQAAQLAEIFEGLDILACGSDLLVGTANRPVVAKGASFSGGCGGQEAALNVAVDDLKHTREKAAIPLIGGNIDATVASAVRAV
jgi:hypothetical protein